MFARLIEFLKGGVRLRFEGANSNRLFRRVCGCGITVYDIARPSVSVIEFTVRRGSVKKVIAISEELCYNHTTVALLGIWRILANIRLRAGLIAGFVLAAGAVGAYSMFIWEIEVAGNDRIPRSAVIESLAEAGARRGVLKKNIDGERLSVKLVAGNPDAADAVVYVRGVRLIVEIRETLEYIPPVDPAEPRDIKSDFDGIVTKLFVISGTAAVKPGDAVKKGQVLISGFVEDAEGNVTACRAEGEVFARVWFSESAVFQSERVELARTGKYSDRRVLRLFGLIFRSGQERPPYALYETERFESVLYKNFLIPVRVATERRYELAERRVTADFEEEKDSIIAGLAARARLRAGDRKITDERTDVREADGHTLVTYNIETETVLHTVGP